MIYTAASSVESCAQENGHHCSSTATVQVWLLRRGYLWLDERWRNIDRCVWRYTGLMWQGRLKKTKIILSQHPKCRRAASVGFCSKFCSEVAIENCREAKSSEVNVKSEVKSLKWSEKSKVKWKVIQYKVQRSEIKWSEVNEKKVNWNEVKWSAV